MKPEPTEARKIWENIILDTISEFAAKAFRVKIDQNGRLKDCRATRWMQKHFPSVIRLYESKIGENGAEKTSDFGHTSCEPPYTAKLQ